MGPSAGKDGLCVFHIMRWYLYTPLYLPMPPQPPCLSPTFSPLLLHCYLPSTSFVLQNQMAAKVRNLVSCHNGLEEYILFLAIWEWMWPTDYAGVLSVARLSICKHIERHAYIIGVMLWCSTACDCNKNKWHRRNALWLWDPKNCCCGNMAHGLPQPGIEISAALEVPHRPVYRSQMPQYVTIQAVQYHSILNTPHSLQVPLDSPENAHI